MSCVERGFRCATPVRYSARRKPETMLASLPEYEGILMNGAMPFPDEEQPRSGGAGQLGLNADGFRLVMRNVASSVAVITVEHKGQKHGMTATAVCSVSAAPPTILVV